MRRTYKIIAVLIIVMLILAAGIRIYFSTQTVTEDTHNTQRINSLSIPKVKASIISSTEGKAHFIEAKFTFELYESVTKQIDQEKLKETIVSILEKMDYDTISDKDGMDYIKHEIAKGVSEYFNEEELIDVYITDIASDFSLPPDSRDR